MTALRDIYLHGALGVRFGRRFRLSVGSPAEAVRALCVLLRGFREAIGDGHYRVIAGQRGRRQDRADEERLQVGFSGPLHIVPVIAGAGGKGLAIGLTIAGALLLATAFAPALLGLGALGSTTVLGVSTSTIGLVGASLALQGVSMLLAPKPKTDDSDQNLQSYMFGGAPSRQVAGRPVPVMFGTFRVTCAPISVQLKNERVA